MSATDTHKKIRITIDGADFTTHDDDQEAAGLLRLAGRDPEKYNLVRLDPDGDLTLFKESKAVDLRDGDTFVSVEQRMGISFTVDGETYTTRDDDQEAGALLRRAGLDPNEYDLARVKPGHEPKVYKNDDKVLEIHEGDVFVSVKQSSPVA